MPFAAADPTGSRNWVVLLIIAVIGFGALQTPQATRNPGTLTLTVVALLAWAGYTVLRLDPAVVAVSAGGPGRAGAVTAPEAAEQGPASEDVQQAFG